MSDASAQVPDEDLRFLAHLEAEDHFTLLVKGHLLLEQALNEAARVALYEAEALERFRWRFGHLTCALWGLRLLSPSEARALLKVNSLRNKLAHGTHDAVTIEMIRSVADQLPRGALDGLRKMVEGIGGKKTRRFLDGRREVVETRMMLLGLYFSVVEAKKRAKQKRRDEENLRSALENYEAVVESEKRSAPEAGPKKPPS